LVFEKNANFFAENWQKSQKIFIITSTPDWDVVYYFFFLKITQVAHILGLPFNTVKCNSFDLSGGQQIMTGSHGDIMVL
jgi:hypothetical protein